MKSIIYQADEIEVKGEMAQWLNNDIYLIDLEDHEPTFTTAVKTYLDECYLFQKATGMNVSEWLCKNHPEIFNSVKDTIFGNKD